MRRKFPSKGTSEFEQIKKAYESCELDVSQIAEMLNMNPQSVKDNLSLYRIKRKEPAITLEPLGNNPLEQRVLDIVQSGAVSVSEISRQIDRSAETVIGTIDTLRERGYDVNLDTVSRQVFIPQEPTKEFKPTEFKYFKKFYRIGLVADTQMCSRYQQVTLLHDAYADFDKRQVDFILHAGDLTDGKNMYRGQENEVFKHGADEQADYVVENYPKLKSGRRTYIIGGNHDRSFYRDGGYNIIRAICKERKDLVDRGFDKAEFIIKGLKVGMQHPTGGVAYARSYRMQKIIENMMGFIHSIPTAEASILEVFGHWHIPCHLPSYMGVDAVSLPCFQSQTPYLVTKGLMPTVGYAVAEIFLDKNNRLSETKISFVNQNAQIKANDY